MFLFNLTNTVFVIFAMLDYFLIEYFLIFVNNDTNVDLKIWGESFLLGGQLSPLAAYLATPLTTQNIYTVVTINVFETCKNTYTFF